MEVERRPRKVGPPLGHERQRDPVERGDLLGRVLVDRVPVGHLQRGGVLQVDLVLSRPPLAFAELAGDRGGLQAVTNLADEPLLLGPLEDVVVLDVLAVRLEVVIVLAAGPFVRVAEQVELQLRGDHREHSPFLGAFDLAAQDLPGRLRDRVPGLVADVAEHERGLFEPRQAAQGPEVGPQPHVVVAGRPAGQAVPRQGLHLDVARQEVAAGMRAVPGDLFDEEPSGDALPHQPALHVHHRGDDRVDFAARHLLVERLERQPAWGWLRHAPRLPSCARLMQMAFCLLPARGRPLQGAGVDPANGYDRGDQQRAPLERVDGDGGDRPHAHGRGAAARAER